MAERTYQQEVKEAAIHRLRAMQKELPPFLDDFFVYCLNKAIIAVTALAIAAHIAYCDVL